MFVLFNNFKDNTYLFAIKRKKTCIANYFSTLAVPYKRIFNSHFFFSYFVLLDIFGKVCLTYR